MEVQNQTNPWNIVGFILGCVAGFTLILAPIHELGHVITSYLVLGNGRIVSWNLSHTAYRWQWQHVVISAMGHGTEVLLAGFIASRIKKKPFYVFARTYAVLCMYKFVKDGLTIDYSDFATEPWAILPFAIVCFISWKFFLLPKKSEKVNSRSEKFEKKPRTV